MTVLPSAGSLQALRRLGRSQAVEFYIACGNPLLIRPKRNDKRLQKAGVPRDRPRAIAHANSAAENS
jgi:hypothetical protein